MSGQWTPLSVAGDFPPHEYRNVDGVVTFRRIEQPVPTTDEPDWQIERDRTLVARLRDDHGPVRERMEEAADRIERLEAGTVAHLPTNEQVAYELIETLPPHVSHAISEPHLDAIAEAVHGMLAKASQR